MSARLLMIALDGADGTRLDQWSADGTLPNLAALRARGGIRKLVAPEGITDDALWASFQYGTSLAEHGRYHGSLLLDSGGMGAAYENETDRLSFWNDLSAQGLRVGIFDVPKCGLPRPLNGIHLVDWLVHGRYFETPRSYPDSLAGEVIEKFGPAPPSRCVYKAPRLNEEELRDVVANLRIAVARKRAAGLHYLASEAWDLFVIGFKESHCAGHHLWDLADPRHPDHDPARNASLGDPLRTIFQDLDAAVGDLVAAAGPAASVVVFSTTDMEPNATLIHLMPQIVTRLNRSLGEFFLVTRVINHLFWRCGANPPLKRPYEILPYNENCAALRINPRWGLFHRPSDVKRTKDEMLERMESILRELTDAETGQPVVAAIDRPSAQHAGARSAALPDLLARYRPGTFPRAVVSPQLGRIEAKLPDLRRGNHAAGGCLFYTTDEFSGVNQMQEFGPLAARMLEVAVK